ncbi:hypothetical protein CROQUDRAFT_49917 [Cronartium quercuum f. sp. fusiforme G11]|uniref:K Homology domain-containing protein n=1 Tax=Cronartium quercuum f. sp. fusiforme G11 TaxID=708437 RepID=A0A9P6N9Z0_9BASI|nr:hypothetical protein CROQUDRAFT_49917 [Cronartium quercuum f. sp. fusiforme G11]
MDPVPDSSAADTNAHSHSTGGPAVDVSNGVDGQLDSHKLAPGDQPEIGSSLHSIPLDHPDADALAHQQVVHQQQLQQQSQPNPVTPTQTIQMRALIVTQDASIIIGKGGRHINEIREKSGARATISEAVPGNAERILSVGGPLDAVSKAFGLIVRRINDEPFEVPSVPGSRAVTIRFVVPNSRMGSVIGKAGSKIKEIQDVSGARVQASEAMLPGSTERVLSISGVADAVHIAVYYVGMILVENQDRMPANTSYRPGHSGGHMHSMGGGGGPGRAGGVVGPAGGGGYYATQGHAHGHAHGHSHSHSAGGGGYPSTAHQPGSQTQQIYIPNELVGAVIGKGGQKINEIRQASATHIKIMEPGEGGQAASANERLVTITGQPLQIQMAVQLLYQRLEAEKQKRK